MLLLAWLTVRIRDWFHFRLLLLKQHHHNQMLLLLWLWWRLIVIALGAIGLLRSFLVATGWSAWALGLSWTSDSCLFQNALGTLLSQWLGMVANPTNSCARTCPIVMDAYCSRSCCTWISIIVLLFVWSLWSRHDFAMVRRVLCCLWRHLANEAACARSAPHELLVALI